MIRSITPLPLQTVRLSPLPPLLKALGRFSGCSPPLLHQRQLLVKPVCCPPGRMMEHAMLTTRNGSGAAPHPPPTTLVTTCPWASQCASSTMRRLYPLLNPPPNPQQAAWPWPLVATPATALLTSPVSRVWRKERRHTTCGAKRFQPIGFSRPRFSQLCRRAWASQGTPGLLWKSCSILSGMTRA